MPRKSARSQPCEQLQTQDQHNNTAQGVPKNIFVVCTTRTVRQQTRGEGSSSMGYQLGKFEESWANNDRNKISCFQNINNRAYNHRTTMTNGSCERKVA
jgi:hypothetical protein